VSPIRAVSFVTILLTNHRYSEAKQQILGKSSLGLTDGILVHFLSSLLAGTVATTICAPADVLKSRVQNAVVVDGIRPVRLFASKSMTIMLTL
jgi:hypothetical protein